LLLIIDNFRHANVYTAEEISSITKDKLIKLQSLYIEQYRHLQHVFKECKRKYVHNLKREKETCCELNYTHIRIMLLHLNFLGNIYNQIRENPKEQRLYKKLKALNKYHRTHGVEAILNKRLHDSRAKVVY
jgi:KAT8 regulatory NSL complex subunit 2